MKIKIGISTLVAYVVLAVIFGIIIVVVGFVSGDIEQFTIPEVIWVAIGASAFHFVLQSVHLLGHAIAAQTTGYPMSGMWYIYVFAMTLYPPDEPPLPARLHIRRSLGGTIGFGSALVVVFLLWSNARDAHWTLQYLTSLMLFDAVFWFAISALFSDGVLFVLGKQWLKSEDETV